MVEVVGLAGLRPRARWGDWLAVLGVAIMRTVYPTCWWWGCISFGGIGGGGGIRARCFSALGCAGVREGREGGG
jgi:hypothetical protein